MVQSPRVSLRRELVDDDRRGTGEHVASRGDGHHGALTVSRDVRGDVQRAPQGQRAGVQRAPPAGFECLDGVSARALREMVPQEHRTDWRRCAHGALQHWLGHQARDGGRAFARARAVQPPRRRSGRASALSGGARGRSTEAPERGAQSHGVVRARRSSRASGARAVHVQLADGKSAHWPREPQAPRSAIRGPRGAMVRRTQRR